MAAIFYDRKLVIRVLINKLNNLYPDLTFNYSLSILDINKYLEADNLEVWEAQVK